MKRVKYAIFFAAAALVCVLFLVSGFSSYGVRAVTADGTAADATRIEEVSAPEAYGPTPTDAQMKYYKDELAVFVHFSMSTFNGKEWSDGTDPADTFNPGEGYDTDKWLEVFSDAGFKRIIVTAKHHDGFNIYPTKITDYDVASSSWKDGKGDVLADVSASCKKYGMDMGVYLSPWDQNLPSYPTDVGPDYNDTYVAQIKEIFSRYGGRDGTIVEFWMDGANGNAANRPKYDIQRWWDTLFELNPDIVFQQNYGAPLRWVGNEAGYASETSWQTINKDYIWNLYDLNGREDAGYLHTGAPYTGGAEDDKNNGTVWSIPEVDVSIRSGWFWKEDQSPKTAEQLAKIYFESVGRGSPLLLNVPPTDNGDIDERDIESLQGFREILDNTFGRDFTDGATAEASETRGDSAAFAAGNVSDDDYDTYWTMDDGRTSGSVTVTLAEPSLIDVVEVQEYVPLGQRIESFDVDVYAGGKWIEFASGTTVGYKRLLQGAPLLAEKIRVTVNDSLAVPLINNISAYKADERIAEQPLTVPGRIEAENYSETYGEVKTESGTGADGSDSLAFIEDGDYVVYRNVRFDRDPVQFAISYAGLGANDIEVRMDSLDGPVLAALDLPSIDSTYRNYRTATADVVYDGEISVGYHDLYLKLNDGINIDWFEFICADTVTIEPAEQIVLEGGEAEIVLKRSGGDMSGTISVTVETVPGTAVEDQCYVGLAEQIVFGPGETEKTIKIRTIDSHYTDSGDIYFDAVIKEPSANASIGYRSSARITLRSSDKSMPDRIQAVDYAQGSPNLLKEQKAPDGGWNIGAVRDGNYALYEDIAFGETPGKIRVCYSGSETPTITFRLGDQSGEVLAVCELDDPGSYDTYIEREYDITYTGETLNGVYDIYVELNAGLNFAWFEFIEDTAA